MESPDPGATPIGWTELLAGTTATVFALVSAFALVRVIAGGPGLGAASRQPDTSAAAPAQQIQDCSGGPVLGGMRLGAARVYPQAGIALEPVPIAVTPLVSAQDAYDKAALKPPGCHTEELLAYYSGGHPLAQPVLAWAVVSAAACGSLECVTVSPVDAQTGQVMAPSSFAVNPAR